MSHKQPLINLICLTLAGYIGDREDISLFDIIGALDTVARTITEEFIDQHPELVPELATLMKMHNAGLH